MKKSILYIAAGLMLAACSPKDYVIEVTNTLDFDRNQELICVDINAPKTGGRLLDSEGNEIAYQATEKEIIFQASVAANSTATYTLSNSEPLTVQTPTRTSAFFLGDRRKDDFAFENDKAGYRMYGPALLPENPSNGVDLWLKHNQDPVMDDMYKQEENGKPYHIDYGLGIDSYKVGHAVGCGGVALVYNDQIWIGGPYSSWEILQKGPLQTVFKLDYDSILVGETILTETIKITVNAGSLVNKAEVTFNGEDLAGLKIGGGIFLHDDENACLEKGDQFIAYAESATSDKGIYAIHEQNGLDANELDFGKNYVSVIVPGMTSTNDYNMNQLAEKEYKVGETFVYYFGGGWSKRDYSTAEEWFEATDMTLKCIENPLQIVLK